MFVFSVKTSRRQLLALLLCIAVLALILLAAFLWPASAASQTAAAIAAADNAARIAYLQSLGYEVDLAYCEVREVLIPEEFDGTFQTYNDMQQAAGMDFTPYQGKRLKCWSYRLLDSGEETLAHLYLYKDEIVGGDISETTRGGRSTALLPRDA